MTWIRVICYIAKSLLRQAIVKALIMRLLRVLSRTQGRLCFASPDGLGSADALTNGLRARAEKVLLQRIASKSWAGPRSRRREAPLRPAASPQKVLGSGEEEERARREHADASHQSILKHTSSYLLTLETLLSNRVVFPLHENVRRRRPTSLPEIYY